MRTPLGVRIIPSIVPVHVSENRDDRRMRSWDCSRNHGLPFAGHDERFVDRRAGFCGGLTAQRFHHRDDVLVGLHRPDLEAACGHLDRRLEGRAVRRHEVLDDLVLETDGLQLFKRMLADKAQLAAPLLVVVTDHIAEDFSRLGQLRRTVDRQNFDCNERGIAGALGLAAGVLKHHFRTPDKAGVDKMLRHEDQRIVIDGNKRPASEETDNPPFARQQGFECVLFHGTSSDSSRTLCGGMII